LFIDAILKLAPHPTMRQKLYTTLYLRLQTLRFCFIKRDDRSRD